MLDAIFGVGLQRPIVGLYADWIAAINASPAEVIGVDLPSGISADDSQILGTATRCESTVTFQVPRLGCGNSLAVNKLEKFMLSMSASHRIGQLGEVHLPADKELFRQALPKRRSQPQGNFWAFAGAGWSGRNGRCGAVGESSSLAGGNRTSHCSSARALRDRLLGVPEVMTWSASQTKDVWQVSAISELRPQLPRYNALVVGCGIGTSEEIPALLEGILLEVRELPVLIDADGLNVLDPNWLREREIPAVLTPHPGELSRLIGQPVSEFQQQRVATVRHWAQMWGSSCCSREHSR